MRATRDGSRRSTSSCLLWFPAEGAPSSEKLLETALGVERTRQIDLFERAQLATVIETCRASMSISAAGRKLLAVSRLLKASGNDADRLRKYLQRFGLTFDRLRSA